MIYKELSKYLDNKDRNSKEMQFLLDSKAYTMYLLDRSFGGDYIEMSLHSSTYKRLFSDLPSIILILDSYGKEIENVQNLFPILEQHFKDHDLNNAKKSI